MPNLLKFKQLQYLFFLFFCDFASAELMVDKTCIEKGLFCSGPLWIPASLLNGLPWLSKVTYLLTYLLRWMENATWQYIFVKLYWNTSHTRHWKCQIICNNVFNRPVFALRIIVIMIFFFTLKNQHQHHYKV